MAIGSIGFDKIKEVEIRNRNFDLGKTVVKITGIYDYKDSYGDFLNFVVYQKSTGKSTLKASALRDIAYEDDPRGYYEVAHSIVRVYINDYFIANVVEAIADNMPVFADAVQSVGIADALNALEGKDLTVWLTRSKKGNLMMSFCEREYKRRLNKGDVGGVDIPESVDDDRELNEEAPF